MAQSQYGSADFGFFSRRRLSERGGVRDGGGRQRPIALRAIDTAGIPPASVGVLYFEEHLAEGEEAFHAFVPAGEEAFAGLVALHYRAGPAAEALIPAAGSAGVDVNRTLALARVFVEAVEVAIGATPRRIVLEELSPDFPVGKMFDRIGNINARKVPMAAQTVFDFPSGHCLGGGKSFPNDGPPDAGWLGRCGPDYFPRKK